ncbi:hypothetical protein [Nocardia sp. NPDC057668]|uniref:SecDF P1 head subdomain-containing protein n=1 Tax=Nocardia sp. NPDC057668 TaxID=3346202 RepID=UPI00366DA2D9
MSTNAVPLRAVWAALSVIGLAAAVAGCGADEPPAGTPVTLTAHTADESRPSPDVLQAARTVIEKRAEDAGLNGTTVEVGTDGLTVTVPGDDGTRARAIGRTGRLHLRPVLSTAPSNQFGTVPGKAQRQSTDPAVQAQTLANLECTDTDPLVDGDDPALPMITCDTDRKTVYLLGPAFIENGIADAQPQLDQRSSRHTVLITFDATAGAKYMAYTAANLYTMVAFTVDGTVLSAPQIQAAMTSPLTQLSGSQLTEESTTDLARTLRFGALPLTFTAS